MWFFAYQYLWASTPYNHSLNVLEQSSTHLKTSLQELSALLDVEDDESIPMLQIESSMIDTRIVFQSIQMQIPSLPSPNPSE